MKLSVFKYCLVIIVAFLLPFSGHGAAYKACTELNTRNPTTISKSGTIVETDFEQTIPVSCSSTAPENGSRGFKERESDASLLMYLIAARFATGDAKRQTKASAQIADFVPIYALLLFPKHWFW